MSNLKNIPCHSLNKQKDQCLFVNTIASPVKLEMFHEWMNEFANLVVSTDSVAIVGEEFGCVRMQECRDIIASYYINKFSKGCSSPRFKMCIRLTETTPFHCAPRRLSYYEREIVSDTVNNLLADKIIRPSNSPYLRLWY